jgi:uncharacterized Zn-binding protein involved in type VI secretion
MLWPAAKMTDMVIGIDKHTLKKSPNHIHPYFGLLYLWHTPKFPSSNVFINGQPALGVGAMGYSIHYPQGTPVKPENDDYWKRYLINIPMSFCLMMLKTVTHMALAGILSFMPRSQASDKFVRDVTGIDISDRRQIWKAIGNNLKQYTQWQTWVKLLIPPLPYIGSQGSTAVGSPNVMVNGAPLAFAAPLVGTSCSEKPLIIIPNACVLGFSNVFVGVSTEELVQGLAVNAAQSAIQAKVGDYFRSTELGEKFDKFAKKDTGCG